MPCTLGWGSGWEARGESKGTRALVCEVSVVVAVEGKDEWIQGEFGSREELLVALTRVFDG
jgi:hypothetical protein